MKFSLCHQLILTFLISNTYAYKILKTEKYGDAGRMMTYASFYTFAYDLDYLFGYNLDTKEMSFDGACYYEPALGTIMLTSANKFGAYSKKFNKTARYVVNECTEYYNYTGTDENLYQSYENATKYAFVLDPATNYTDTIFYVPAVLSVDMIENRYKFYESIYFNFDSISLFAGFFYLFFVAVFLIHGISNLFIKFGIHTKFNGSWLKWYRANISIPAMFTDKHTQEASFFKIFTTLVPTRIESIVIFLFICLNVLLTCVHYDFTSTVLPKSELMLEAIADRTGLLSFGLVPLLIIFAGRNNVLISLTGIPYTTFIQYHKWVARFMTIHAIIHSICWSIYGALIDYFKGYYTEEYWRWGAVATVACSLILFQAFHMFRKMSYEVFLVIHIVLAAIFLVGCFYHCIELGYLEWIWVSMALWVVDRIVRAVRILIFGIRKAEIKYISDDTFKVVVKHNKWFQPFPGAYAFIHFGTPLFFWQTHPFTILTSVNEENTIIIYIKVKKGLTRLLKRKMDKAPDSTIQMYVGVEGPYGHRSPVEKYDSVLLLAGGNGIPGLFSHAYDLAVHGLAEKKHVNLIWSIRNADSLIWFQDQLKALRGSSVKIDIFITGKKQQVEKKSITFEDNKDSSSDNAADKASSISSADSIDGIINELSTFIKFHYERPNVEEIIKSEMLNENNPSVAVVSCGPPIMVDLARKAVASNLQKAKGRVDLFEELQVW